MCGWNLTSQTPTSNCRGPCASWARRKQFIGFPAMTLVRDLVAGCLLLIIPGRNRQSPVSTGGQARGTAEGTGVPGRTRHSAGAGSRSWRTDLSATVVGLTVLAMAFSPFLLT